MQGVTRYVANCHKMFNLSHSKPSSVPEIQSIEDQVKLYHKQSDKSGMWEILKELAWIL